MPPTKKASKKTAPKKVKRGRVPKARPSTETPADHDADNGVVALGARSKGAGEDPPDWAPWYRPFVNALGTEYSVTNASAVAGVARRTAQRHKKLCQSFSDAWDQAWEGIVDELEASAMRRAVRGNVEPIMFRSQRVGAKRTFETSLTIFMLKQNRRGKYGQDLNADERDARELAREFRQAMSEMDDTVPEWSESNG